MWHDPESPLTPYERKVLEKLDPDVKELAKFSTITDMWGFRHNWTNIDEGWYPLRKYIYLDRLELQKKQRNTVKKFTEFGYKVMKIPTFLYETLINQRDEASIREENCENVKLSNVCFKP